MRKLKCWIGNLDGLRQGIVVAASQKEAAKIVGTSMRDFAAYWSEREPNPAAYFSIVKTRTLYTRPYGGLACEKNFVEGRCVIEKKKREARA